MIKFAYIYAMPGIETSDLHHVKTHKAEFFAASVDFANRQQAVAVAKRLVKEHQVNMLELCGGLANADLVARVKEAVGPQVAVGQVMYGPEYRRPLVDLLEL